MVTGKPKLNYAEVLRADLMQVYIDLLEEVERHVAARLPRWAPTKPWPREVVTAIAAGFARAHSVAAWHNSRVQMGAAPRSIWAPRGGGGQ